MEIVEWQYDDVANLSCDVVTSDKCKLPRVLVVIVHGGAWMLGSKETFRGMARQICHEIDGVTCVVPDYSLSRVDASLVFRSKLILSLLCFQVLCIFLCRHKRGRGPAVVLMLILFFIVVISLLIEYFILNNKSQHCNAHPRHVRDVARCITMSCERLFAGDEPVKIVLIGHSAGAHLCSLLTLDSEYLSPRLFNSIVGTVVISGIYSLWEMQRSSTRFFLNKNIFVGMFDEIWTQRKLDALKHENPEQWRYITSAWPLFHVTDAANKKTPFLILTSDTDFFILQHSLAFANELERSGFRNQHIHFKNTTHFSIHKHWRTKHKHICDCVREFILELVH